MSYSLLFIHFPKLSSAESNFCFENLLNWAYMQKLIWISLKVYRIYRFDDTHRILAVKKSGVEAIEDYLDDMDVAYTVEAEDFQKVINEENPPQKDIELLQSKNRKLQFIRCFLSSVDNKLTTQ